MKHVSINLREGDLIAICLSTEICMILYRSPLDILLFYTERKKNANENQ